MYFKSVGYFINPLDILRRLYFRVKYENLLTILKSIRKFFLYILILTTAILFPEVNKPR